MRKGYLIILIFLLSIEIAYAVPAPFNEYYYNPETNQCNRYWRGDEHGGGDVIPEGFYFSGYDDVNCTEFNLTQFNMTKYQECKSLGGKYLMQNLTTYDCSFEYTKESNFTIPTYEGTGGTFGGIFLIFVFLILVVLFFYFRRKGK